MMARLSAMMFFQSLPLGAWGVTIGTYLAANTGEAGSGAYSAGFIGYSTAAGAIGGLISPAVFGVLSDRFFSAQHLLSLCHLGCCVGAIGMFVSETEGAFFLWLLLYFHFYSPSIALSNKIGLRHVEDTDADFPLVRVFGTVGWISAGLAIGLIWPWVTGASIEATKTPLLLGALADLLVAAYALSLPPTPPERHETGGTSSGEASSPPLLWRPTVVLFLIVALLACVPSMAYNNYSNPFLNFEGYSNPAALMTLGQVSEILVLWAMPWLIIRITLKRLFTLGLIAWAFRYGLLATAAWTPLPMAVYAAILLHGACFAFIYVGGPMYMDHLVAPSDRGFAQGVYSVAATGIGHLLGALLVGSCQAHFLTPEGVTPPPYDWTSFWIVPATVSLATAALFAVSMRSISVSRLA